VLNLSVLRRIVGEQSGRMPLIGATVYFVALESAFPGAELKFFPDRQEFPLPGVPDLCVDHGVELIVPDMAHGAELFRESSVDGFEERGEIFHGRSLPFCSTLPLC